MGDMGTTALLACQEVVGTLPYGPPEGALIWVPNGVQSGTRVAINAHVQKEHVLQL